MRSIIAGLVGGVSGGATVLALMAGLGTHRVRTTSADSYVRGVIDEPVAMIPTATLGDSPHPAALSESRADQPGGRAEVSVRTIIPVRTDDITEEDFSMSSPPALTEITQAVVDEPLRTETQVPGLKPTPTEFPTLASAGESSAADPITAPTAPVDVVPARLAAFEALATDGAMPTASQAPSQPDPLPAEVPTITHEGESTQPKASPSPGRVFRLHVPKDLPTVDLGFSPTIKPVKLSDSAALTGPEGPTGPSGTAAAAQPLRLAAATPIRAPAARGLTASRTTSSTPGKSDEAGGAQDPNQSAQESLQRASDAVKRLSRRMGGRFGR